ncbi:MAG: hypothetical protein LW720_13950 [Pirellula sp.]|jgi:hypothetical protein|nr:hypothetical protein [Pirellula sp.]
MAASGAVAFSRSLVVPLWNAVRLTIYCYRYPAIVPGHRFRSDPISEATVEYEYRDAEYE